MEGSKIDPHRNGSTKTPERFSEVFSTNSPGKIIYIEGRRKEPRPSTICNNYFKITHRYRCKD
jgi:hypothetical protein